MKLFDKHDTETKKKIVKNTLNHCNIIIISIKSKFNTLLTTSKSKSKNNKQERGVEEQTATYFYVKQHQGAST